MKCRHCRVGIANLADENHVGILAKDRAQGSRKSEPRLLVYRNLADAIDLIFNRILDGNDVHRLLPDLVDESVERRRLSTAGRTDGQQHSLRPPDKSMQALLDGGAKSELRQGHERSAAPQHPN